LRAGSGSSANINIEMMLPQAALYLDTIFERVFGKTG